MAYQEVAKGRRFIKFKDCETGKPVAEGIFEGEVEGRFGPQYEIIEDSGYTAVLNASGQLKYKFQFINPGDRVLVVYLGMERLESGTMAGKDCHTFQVLRDTDWGKNSEEEPEPELPMFDEDLEDPLA